MDGWMELLTVNRARSLYAGAGETAQGRRHATYHATYNYIYIYRYIYIYIYIYTNIAQRPTCYVRI